MTKYQKHHLSDENNNKLCPLSGGDSDIQCDSFCAWFDHELQDCRMIGGFWKVVEAIRDINNDKPLGAQIYDEYFEE